MLKVRWPVSKLFDALEYIQAAARHASVLWVAASVKRQNGPEL